MRTAIFSVLLGSFALLQACSGESGRPVDASPPPSADTSGPPSATTIRAKIAAGASCAELFEARNALDPHSPDIPTINVNLREIGCNSSGSTRSK